ncbi:MAG: carbohydrate ABC transporter permease [Acholeplasmataceae bacterium]
MARKKMSKRTKKRLLQFYLFIMPGILGFLIFTIYPVFYSFVISFTNRNLLDPANMEFVGFQNYRAFFTGQDPLFGITLRNTFVFAVLNVVGTNVIALLTALLLTAKVKFINMFRTIFFLPSLLPAVASAIMFRWLFDPTSGLVNGILRLFGVSEPPLWLDSADTALYTLVFISLYAFGGKMVIYISGLNNVSKDHYESADIDGANMWNKFIYITIPLISPIIFYNFLMGSIGALQVFTEGFVISGSGPNNSTLFYILRLYNLAYLMPFRLGQAAAMAWVLFAITAVISGVYFIINKKLVYYES